MSSVADAVARYAGRFHRAVDPSQHVASPLGAWLVLALAASAASGSTRDELAEVLGCDIEAASYAARELLESTHTALALGAAAWTEPAIRIEDLPRWLDALPAAVEQGPIPSQADADRWAADKTLGLIREFPIRMSGVVFALATAIATKISWPTAFHPFPAERVDLAPAAGFDKVEWLLTSADGGAIVSSPVGPVAVHVAPSRDDDLVVVSVIADPSVPVAEVLDVAYPIAIAAARDEDLPGRISLWDLPLGTGHSWTVTERNIAERETGTEQHRVVLPAWSIESRYDLLRDPRFGFRPAAQAVMSLFPSNGLVPEAVQAAVARYTRTGFEAAAITVLALSLSARVGEATVTRAAQLEFTRPYAVVAVARGSGPWHGLPVFSAWITGADESDSWDDVRRSQ